MRRAVAAAGLGQDRTWPPRRAPAGCPAVRPGRCCATGRRRRGRILGHHDNAMAASATTVAYLAPDGFLPELLQELGEAASEVHGRLVLAPGDERPLAWIANVWRDARRIPISSIGDAAKKL